MKYLFKTLIVVIIIYIISRGILFVFYRGHNINYNIGNFLVKEKFTANDKYYFKIKSDKMNINFKIKENYNKSQNVIKKLIYEEVDGYKCLLPIFKDKKIITDIMCLKDDTIFYAGSLNNILIINKFQKHGYDPNKFQDSAKKLNISNTQSIYKENISKNTYLAIETYRGLTLFNGKDTKIKLFENDVYKKPISIFTDKYYIVADYASEYTFKNFHVVNIINGEKNNIRSYNDISFDSYIMGEVDNNVYLFDKENKEQYKIDLKYETVETVGNKNDIKFYNGKWSNISLQEALKEKKFTTYNDEKGYEKVDKFNGYYYYYKKEDEYKIYRSDEENPKLKTYLFSASDLNTKYIKDKIYFRKGTDFCYYTNKGVRKVLTEKELEFNDDITLGIYEK